MLDDMLSANLPIAPQTHFAALSRWLEMESRAERQRLGPPAPLLRGDRHMRRQRHLQRGGDPRSPGPGP